MVKINMWHTNVGTTEAPEADLTIKHEIQYAENENKIREIKKELDALIGLRDVKKHINEIHAFMEIQKKRHREKLHTESQALHMVFKGNPGTGKTTVARILGKLFKESDILPKGHLVEVERADLVGEYIGHTAQKCRSQIKKSLGGILFIDEAYSLARGGEKDFGKEAIDTLVKSMEDHKGDLIIIMAGYVEEMNDFLQVNPGLRSRFPIHINFPNYTADEMLAISDIMLEQRQYQLSGGAREELRTIIEGMPKLGEQNGNARMARNLIERAMRVQAVRLMDALSRTREITRDDLLLLTKGDLVTAKDSVQD